MAAFTRIGIRLHTRSRLHLDDFMLLFACICLVAATALLYHGTVAIYFAEQLALNPKQLASVSAATPVNPMAVETLLDQLVLFQRIIWSYLALTWTAIFAVKFAFLVFFRRLVDRLPVLTMFWKFVLACTVLVYGFCVCDAFISCSKLGMASRMLSQPIPALTVR